MICLGLIKRFKSKYFRTVVGPIYDDIDTVMRTCNPCLGLVIPEEH